MEYSRIKMRNAIILSASIVIFLCSCNRNNYAGKSLTKNDVIKWEVVFKKNITTDERSQAISLLEKYIINNFYSENKGIVLNNFKFRFNFQNLHNERSIIIGCSIGYAATNAVSTIIPPKGPPKHEIFTGEISPFIDQIRSALETH